MASSDPREAWEKLQVIYGSRLATSKALLLSEMAQMKYGGSGIIEFKARMDAIRLGTFMSSLPEEYDIMSTTGHNDGTTFSSRAGFNGRGGPTRPYNRGCGRWQGSGLVGTCFVCGVQGHITRNCPARHKTSIEGDIYSKNERNSPDHQALSPPVSSRGMFMALQERPVLNSTNNFMAYTTPKSIHTASRASVQANIEWIPGKPR